MNGIGQIFKKEMDRVFKDKKMLFSVFVLPVVIMIGVLYLISTFATNMSKDIEKHVPIVYIENGVKGFEDFLTASQKEYNIKTVTTEKGRKDAEHAIKNGDGDLLIEFPDQFAEKVANYQVGDEVPQIKTYYNPSEDYSNVAYREISSDTLEAYRQTLLSERVGNLETIAVFTVNSDNKQMIIQDEQKASGKALGMMLPYFITILLFAGAMGIGTDMVAGEKERGTMASMLVSPVKRSSIVLGKVFSLMALTGISSVIYVGAMGIFMPVMSKAMTGADGDLSINLTLEQIIMLGALLVALAFLYSTIIVLISVFAKTVKEANSYIMPAYMVILVIGLMTMFSTGGTSQSAYYIPVYNSSLALKGILSQEVTMAQYGITLGMTFALGIILMGVIVKAFESEKVMAS